LPRCTCLISASLSYPERTAQKVLGRTFPIFAAFATATIRHPGARADGGEPRHSPSMDRMPVRMSKWHSYDEKTLTTKYHDVML
jgi:hypothetical protein